MERFVQTALAATVAGLALMLVAPEQPADAQIVAAAPDLVPVPSRILQGTVLVRNVGSANAGAFVVTAQCQKQGLASGGGCADHPGLKAYADPKYPNRVAVKVSGLAKGKVFNHKLPFWNQLDWDPGNYNFLIEADAGKAVAESNEGNNIAGAVLSK